MRIQAKVCALAMVAAVTVAGCTGGSGSNPLGLSVGGSSSGVADSAAATAAAAAAAAPSVMDTDWAYTPRMTAPLTATAGDTEVTLGGLAEYGIEVTIPAGAFTEPTEVTLADPKASVTYASTEMTGIGTPFDLSVGDGSPVRLQQPVTVRMTFDPAKLGADFEYGSLRFGYLNGDQWEYVVPEVDTASNTMSFTTSHFSLFGQVKATTDEQVKQYVTNAAVAAYAGKQGGILADKAVENVIDAILTEKLKITDATLKGKLVNSILKDDEYADMIKGVAQGDPAAFNQGFNVLIGKKIAEQVPASTLRKALGAVTGDFGVETVQKASEAAAYLAEGRTKDAARIIGEHLADQFLLTHVAKAAVAVVDGQISSWKNAEVEAAYQVYKNGASSKLPWGYHVEKGNFDDVWGQMGGAARQLEIESIAAQEKVRRDAGMPALTDAEKEKLRSAVQTNLKKQFEERVTADDEIAKKSAELAMVMTMFKDAGFLEKGTWGWDKGYELQQRLDILAHFKDKLLADTGRSVIIDGYGHSADGISIQELKTLAMGWFGAENSAAQKKVYADFLFKTYGISSFPAPEELNGKWGSSSMTITDFDLGPPPTGKPGDSNVVGGCDLNDPEIYNQMKKALEKERGKKRKSSMALKLGKDGRGVLVVTDANGKKMSLPATYENGTLKASLSDKGVGYTYEGSVSGEGAQISLDGSFKLGLGAKGAYIGGNWAGSK
jgi:hypothetical protein